MKNFQSFFAIFLVMVMSFMTVSCSSTTSNLVVALNAVADASSVAVVTVNALVAAGTVDPATAALVGSYATAVSSAAQKSITELDSSDTNVQKIAIITAAFAAVAAPAFGPNVAPAVTAVIGAVTIAVQLFLQQLNSQPVTLAAKLAPTAPIKLDRADKALLKKALTKLQQVDVLAAKLAPKQNKP